MIRTPSGPVAVALTLTINSVPLRLKNGRRALARCGSVS